MPGQLGGHHLLPPLFLLAFEFGFSQMKPPAILISISLPFRTL